jgi:hypothetical protein
MMPTLDETTILHPVDAQEPKEENDCDDQNEAMGKVRGLRARRKVILSDESAPSEDDEERQVRCISPRLKSLIIAY